MGLKFEPKKFKFGMRTLKTGIAVFLVLGLFSALGWEGLQIGCLTAVFSLRENFDRSIQFGFFAWTGRPRIRRICSESIQAAWVILYGVRSTASEQVESGRS